MEANCKAKPEDALFVGSQAWVPPGQCHSFCLCPWAFSLFKPSSVWEAVNRARGISCGPASSLGHSKGHAPRAPRPPASPPATPTQLCCVISAEQAAVRPVSGARRTVAQASWWGHPLLCDPSPFTGVERQVGPKGLGHPQRGGARGPEGMGSSMRTRLTTKSSCPSARGN